MNKKYFKEKNNFKEWLKIGESKWFNKSIEEAEKILETNIQKWIKQKMM